MEDLQQRRQRLAALREEAALEDSSDAMASKIIPSSSLSLPNPMMDAPPVTAAGTNKASGFDFYTDPLTAFTGAKRRKPVVEGGIRRGGPPFGPSVMRAPPWQPAQFPPPGLNHPPHHHPELTPPPHLSGNHGWQPTPYQPPVDTPPPPAHSMNQQRNFSNQSHGRGLEMGFGGRGRGYSPAGGRGGYANEFSGRGRGYAISNNHTWNSSGSGSARGSIARGSQGRAGQRGGKTPSAKEQPHLYYKESMVRDPWVELEEKLKRSAKDR